MTSTKETAERRKHKRFKVQAGAFAVLRPQWPYSTKLGQVIDMSMGGLAFRYIDTEGETSGPCELDIFTADSNFYLHEIPFKNISDFEMDNVPSLASIRMRRCGLQFGELTQSQIFDLEYFIQNHATGEGDV